MGRRLVSDGRLYHIDTIVYGKPLGFFAALAGLAAQITAVANLWSLSEPPPVANTGTSESGAPHVGSSLTVSSAGYPYHDWRSGLAAFWAGLRDPLTLPAATAAATNETSYNGPGSSPVASWAHYWPKDIAQFFIDENSKKYPYYVLKRQNSEGIPEEEIQPKGNPAIIYMIDNKDYSFDIPNTYVLRYLNQIQIEFYHSSPSSRNNIDTLLAFDDFIGEKLKVNFNRALYLQNTALTVELIMLKLQTEKIIIRCQENIAASQDTIDKIKISDQNNIKIDALMPKIHYHLITSMNDLDMDLILEAIDFKSGISFLQAKENLIEEYKIADETQKEKYINLYKIINQMQEAHGIYSDYLTYHPQTKNIEQTMFISDIQIFSSLLHGNSEMLENSFLKRIFYLIFEYTRLNDLSIMGNVFIVPGELTKYKLIFEEDESELKTDEITPVMVNELIKYLNAEDDDDSLMSYIIKLIDIFTVDHPEGMDHELWYQTMSTLFIKVKNVLEENIKNSIYEKKRYLLPPEWRIDYNERLFRDKKTYILLEIIIDIYDEFYDIFVANASNKNIIFAENDEQRIAKAKLNAIYKRTAETEIIANQADLLDFFKQQVEGGDIPLLFTAALNWHCSNNGNDFMSISKNGFLNIIREFAKAERQVLRTMGARVNEQYTSVYKLKRSNEMKSTEEYFNQFIEYNIHDCYHEARNLTMNAIQSSTLSYYELINNPLKSMFFKIYSRNYVQNVLSHDTWVSSPENNIGHIAIVMTNNNKLYLISTLSNISIIKNVNFLKDGSLLEKFTQKWEDTPTELLLRSRPKFELSEDDILTLFSGISANQTEIALAMELILIRPEENKYSNPMPPFSSTAVKEMNIVKPLIEIIDMLHEKMLIEISDTSKEMLIDRAWTDYITAQIPFYSLFWRYWNDASYNIEIKDCIFEIFDLVLTFFPSGIAFNNSVFRVFVDILKIAKIKKIPISGLRNYLLQEFSKTLPSLLYSESLALGYNLASYISPLPLPPSLVHWLISKFESRIGSAIFQVNKIAQKNKEMKEKIRQEWSTNIDTRKYTLNSDGIYSPISGHAHPLQYIKDRLRFFKVEWDKSQNTWRVLSPDTGNKFNLAMPVKLMNNGENAFFALAESNHHSPINFLKIRPSIFGSSSGRLQFESRDISGMNTKILTADQLQHKRSLLFFLSEALNDLQDAYASGANKKDILQQIINLLTGHRPIGLHRHIMDNFDETYLSPHVSGIGRISIDSISFRSISYWLNQFDHHPISSLALVVKVHHTALIIDLFFFHPIEAMRIRGESIFLENEWGNMYRNTLPAKYSLVKFKDYNSYDGTLDFQSQATLYPGKFIQNAYLLREPDWYKPEVTNHYNAFYNEAYALNAIERNSIRLAARKAIYIMRSSMGHEQFPLLVLKEAKLLSKYSERSLSADISKATTQAIPEADYLEHRHEITYFDELLRVNEGKWLAVIDDAGLLKRLMISVGNGRFGVAGASFFDKSLSDLPCIIVAEEMGTLVDKKLKLRYNGRTYRIVAGNAALLPELIPTLVKSLPQKKVVEYGETNQIISENFIKKTREEVLLGKDWRIQKIAGLETRIRIQAHGSPFNVNYMDATELSHAIRGLLLSQPEQFNFNQLQSIELFSCFSGYGNKYSTAQILANELNLAVNAFPAKISHSIRQRRPEWFKTYLPLQSKTGGAVEEYVIYKNKAKTDQLAKRHAQLHNLMTIICDIKKAIGLGRNKRAAHMLPTIYIDLALVIISNISLDDFIARYSLPPGTKASMQSVLNEYAIKTEDSDKLFMQAYLDIINSIDELSYLFNQWQ